MNKATPWLLGGVGLLGLSYWFSRKAAASVTFVPKAVPDGPPTSPKTPAPTPRPKPVVVEPPPYLPAVEGPRGTPATVPGYDAMTVPCSEGGELGAWDDLQLKQIIDRSTDPGYLNQVAAALLQAKPPCTVRGNYALTRAAQVAADQAAQGEPSMGGLQNG